MIVCICVLAPLRMSLFGSESVGIERESNFDRREWQYECEYERKYFKPFVRAKYCRLC